MTYLGQAAGAETPEALLNYGGGIAVVIASLAFFMRHGDRKKMGSNRIFANSPPLRPWRSFQAPQCQVYDQSFETGHRGDALFRCLAK